MLLLIFSAAIWGFAFLFQKTAMRHVGPIQFVTARSLVATLALLPLALHEMRGHGGSWASVLRVAVPAGVAFYIAAVLQQVGLVTATVTNTGFLTALYVVITPFIAWALLGRRPVVVVWASVIMSFVGTWLLGGGTLAALSVGDRLVAASAFFWALHVVLVGRAAPVGRPIAFTTLQFFVVGLIGAVTTPFVEPVSFAKLGDAWIEIAFVGILSSALTFTLFSIAVRHTGPSEATIIVSMETLFAAFGAWLFLGEGLSVLGWAGAGLILTAALLVQLAPARRADGDEATRPSAGG
ncbi:MAG: DMT family transporter [Hyphomicrobiaceae bacterium]